MALIELGSFLHSDPGSFTDYNAARSEAIEHYYVINDYLSSPQPSPSTEEVLEIAKEAGMLDGLNARDYIGFMPMLTKFANLVLQKAPDARQPASNEVTNK